MKKLFVVCFVSLMLMPLMSLPLGAQGSKLQAFKGTWCLAENEKYNPFTSLGKEIKFQDDKCIITNDLNMKRAYNVEEGEDNLYITIKPGESIIVSIIDSNTISINVVGSGVIYKRKQK